MRSYSQPILASELSSSKEPRFVVQISWDDADTDYLYLTSSTAAQVPVASPAVDVIHNSVFKISGQTQRINPDIAASTIGSMTIQLLDATDNTASPPTENLLSTRISTKLAATDGLRGKIVRVYVGYEQMTFDQYDLRLTYIIDGVSYKDKKYTLTISDIQRSVRHKIFTPQESNLNLEVDETTLIIPVISIDSTLFPAVTHGSEWSVRPGETVGYIKIEDECICHTGGLSFSGTVGWHVVAIERGALNTTAVKHTFEVGTEDNRKPQVIEHVFIEGPAPKVIYALLTGELLNGSPADALPDHWHLGIAASFVRLIDFENIGLDLWNTSTDQGRSVRIENPGSQDGKRFIEKEMLLWMGCFMPIYTTGELGLKKLAVILSNSGWLIRVNKNNVISYGDLKHDMRSVINHIVVDWNWIDLKSEFTKQSIFIDSESITIHGSADERSYKFKAVHTGRHTDEDLLTYFDVLRDRYSGPPLMLSLTLMPHLQAIDVGDTVKVDIDQIIDMNTGLPLSRTFEVQQATSDWMTGALNVKLFGSSQKAGALARTTLSNVLLDSFYTQAGTNLTSALTIVAGVVTVSGTLTGHASDVDNAGAIFYYDGNLEINAGVTVTVEENVQLRIKGNLTIDGDIDGIGTGATGGGATTLFENGTTTTTYTFGWLGTAPSDVDYDYGEQGYFGYPDASNGWWGSYYLGTLPPALATTPTGQRFDYEYDYVSGVYTNLDPTISTITIPHFQLVNDQQTNTLTGYQKDLRGNAGAGGTPYQHTYGTSTLTQSILASGGAGGNGGAGLLIVSRGLSFGPDGFIDLSGGDSSIGASYTQSTGSKFYGSAGASGAPGALVILQDGQQTNPDIDNTKFIANYGDAPVPVGATEVDLQWLIDLPIQYAASIGELAAYGDLVYSDSTTENDDMSAAAHRFQYIPEDETPDYAAQDEALFNPIDPYEYTETNRIQLSPPAASDQLGTDVAVTNDGNRLICGAKGKLTPVIANVHVFRSIDNTTLEQSIADPTAATDTFFGNNVGINNNGDRFFSSADGSTVSGAANSGLVYIYTRALIAWTVEQALASPTPADSASFGDKVCWDDSDENLIARWLQVSTASIKLNYWSRTGTTWTDRGIINAGITVRGTTHAMSASGNYALFGDNLLTVGGVANAGAAYLFERSGTTWSKIAALTPDAVARQWSLESGALDYDATTIVFSASTGGGSGRVGVYRREGDVFNLLQILESPEGHSTNAFGKLVDISSSGLILMVNDPTNLEIYIYRRSSTSQAFADYQVINDNDVGVVSNEQSVNLSRSGKILTIGNWNTNLTAIREGAVYIWKTLAN